MSGIVGLINLDREPVNPGVLRQMCRPLEPRAPDGCYQWLHGCVGLANASLVIEPGDRDTEQPLTLDGKAWITADVHLYSTEELEHRLRSSGVRISSRLSDPQLLLLAYRNLGLGFVQHLVGDFAFAIWDAAESRLVCARDHLGVRPFYYVQARNFLGVASDIDALLAHPRVSAELNEDHLADFLLFGSSIERHATAYKNVLRLPPAHLLVADADGVKLQEYWTPPLHQTIRYPQARDYTDHFNALFEQAVTQRIPSSGLALELSGGLDSGSIAAVAARHCRAHGIAVQAFTNTCHGLLPEDREGHFAQAVADYLDVPIHFLASEGYPLFDRFDSPELRTAEPFGNPDLAQHFDKCKSLKERNCRTLFSGQVGDALFAGSSTFFPQLLRTGHWLQLLIELNAHRSSIGSWTGTGLLAAPRRLLNRLVPTRPWQPRMPTWLNPDFAQRVKLTDRWRGFWELWREQNDQHEQLRRPWFSDIFRDYEAIKLPLVVRHPFADVRLMEFMLKIPTHLHFNKRLLRETMAGRLPAVAVSRPKEGLVGDLHKAKMARGLIHTIKSLETVSPFVQIEEFLALCASYPFDNSVDTTWSTWHINAPIALAFWMHNNARLDGRAYETPGKHIERQDGPIKG